MDATVGARPSGNVRRISLIPSVQLDVTYQKLNEKVVKAKH